MRMIHLVPASNERSTLRAGVRGRRCSINVGPNSEALTLANAVFAMPLLRDFAVTYQWVRELRHMYDGQRIVAVHIRIPEDEWVYVGRYNDTHMRVPATAAARWVEVNPAGAQVIIPRALRVRDIVGSKAVTQLVGWQHTPEGKMTCICQACLPAGSRELMRRVRGAYMNALRALDAASTTKTTIAALYGLSLPFERAKGRLPMKKIVPFCKAADASIRCSAAALLRWATAAEGQAALVALLCDDDRNVRFRAAESLALVIGVARTASALENALVSRPAIEDTVVEFIECLPWMGSPRAVAAALQRFAKHPCAAIAATANQAQHEVIRLSQRSARG